MTSRSFNEFRFGFNTQDLPRAYGAYIPGQLGTLTGFITTSSMEFLRSNGGSFTFMDNVSYDQLNVEAPALGDAARFVKEGDSAVLSLYDGEIVGVDLPAAVELTVSETEPGLQGDRVSGARKPATLETGLVVSVPLFVNTGDRIKVDTRSGEYLTRAQ